MSSKSSNLGFLCFFLMSPTPTQWNKLIITKLNSEEDRFYPGTNNHGFPGFKYKRKEGKGREEKGEGEEEGRREREGEREREGDFNSMTVWENNPNINL